MVVYDGFDSDGGGERSRSNSEVDFFEAENADEARLRLAKQYVSAIGGDEGTKRKRLREDIEKTATNKVTAVGDDFKLADEPLFFQKGHTLTCTSVCVRKDESRIYSGGKDCAIFEYDTHTAKKLARFSGQRKGFDCGGHFEEVLSVAFCDSLGLLVSVGKDALVRLWDPRNPQRNVAELYGHKGAVTGVVADPGTAQVFTVGRDKIMKLWDLQHKATLDHFLGHTEGISCIDICQKSRPITGSVDKSARFWRTAQDSHLVFAQHTAPVDAICALQPSIFASGSQDGDIHVHSTESSKPLASLYGPHDSKWISSLGCVRNSDFLVSGSSDGVVRTWRLRNSSEVEQDGGAAKRQKAVTGDKKKAKKGSSYTLESRQKIPLRGVVNQICESQNLFVCAVGAEHRLGRWERISKAKNGVCVLKKENQ